MRVADVRQWSVRSTFAAGVLLCASSIALAPDPAVAVVPGRGGAAKVAQCRKGMTAWTFHKRSVCLATRLRALPLPTTAGSAVAGALRSVLFNDTLEQIARRHSSSRAVRRSPLLGDELRKAMGRGGTSGVVKGVEAIVQRLADEHPLALAARRGSGRVELHARAADGAGPTIADPTIDANGNFRQDASYTTSDGVTVKMNMVGKLNPDGSVEGSPDLSVSLPPLTQPDGTTAQARFSLSIPVSGGELPDCPPATGILDGKANLQFSSTVIIKRGSRIVSTHTKTIAVTESIHGVVGDDGLLAHADVDTTIHGLDAQHLEALGGLIGGPLVLEADASVGARFDGGALRAGGATPYTLSDSSGSTASRTVGYSIPFLIDPKRDSQVVHQTADELTRNHADLIKSMLGLVEAKLRRAEKHWYDEEGCVKLTATAPPDADPGAVVPVTLYRATAAGKDLQPGKEFRAAVRASGTASITPTRATLSPGTPTIFQLTVPGEPGSSGSWTLVAVGKGGKKTISGAVSVRNPAPEHISVQVSATHHRFTPSPVTVTWSGTALATRDHNTPPGTMQYSITSMNVAGYTYKLVDALSGCTIHGTFAGTTPASGFVEIAVDGNGGYSYRMKATLTDLAITVITDDGPKCNGTQEEQVEGYAKSSADGPDRLPTFRPYTTFPISDTSQWTDVNFDGSTTFVLTASAS